MFSTTRAMFRDPEGKVLLLGAFTIVAIGTGAYSLLEGWSLVDSLYFSVVALATVGFGDLHPTTDVSKLFTVVYILSGLGILGTFISELTKYRPVGRRLAQLHEGDRVDHPDGGPTDAER